MPLFLVLINGSFIAIAKNEPYNIDIMPMLIKDILLTFLDFGVETFDIFDATGFYRRPIKQYRKWRKKYEIKSEELYRLKRMGLLEVTDADFSLTKKGIAKLQHAHLEKLTIPEQNWDGKWRIVIFDIPETKKPAREKFRNKLKELGFESLQKSVFCYPYECLKEVTIVAKYFEIERHITYLEVIDIVTERIYSKFSVKKIPYNHPYPNQKYGRFFAIAKNEPCFR